MIESALQREADGLSQAELVRTSEEARSSRFRSNRLLITSDTLFNALPGGGQRRFKDSDATDRIGAVLDENARSTSSKGGRVVI
jgi:hypothetical protein